MLALLVLQASGATAVVTHGMHVKKEQICKKKICLSRDWTHKQVLQASGATEAVTPGMYAKSRWSCKKKCRHESAS